MSTNYPSTNDPDAIRADIERTREELSRDVNALGESVSPSHVAHRQAQKVKGRAGAVRDRIMGSASDAGDTTSDLTHAVGDTASHAGRTVQRKTQGNPLAAGLIAVAAGWLVGSLMPASEKERQLSQTLKDKAEPVVQEAKNVASESAEHLKEPAQDAVQSVKATAQSAAEDVKQEGRQAADDVRQSATESADTVKNQAQG